MKFFIVCSFIFLNALLSYSQTKIQRVVLSWDFFVNDMPSSSKHDALTWYQLNYTGKVLKEKSQELDVKMSVVLSMDTSKSYFNFKKKFKSEELLNHEQGHADIGYIYAKKLQTAFDNAKFTKQNYANLIKTIYGRIYNELNQENQRYDSITNHGLNKLEQDRWNAAMSEKL